MKSTIIAVLILTLAGSVLLGGEPLQPIMRARPIQIISCNTWPDHVPIDLKPMGHKSGFEIWYLIEGKDLAGVNSVVIDAIRTPEGADISKDRDGHPTYELGPFPQNSTDGKYAVFSRGPRESVSKS